MILYEGYLSKKRNVTINRFSANAKKLIIKNMDVFQHKQHKKQVVSTE